MKESHNIIYCCIPFWEIILIFFLNGVGVFYLYIYLIEFLDNVLLDNKLMSAAFYDLHVLAYKVACQALGLIDKLDWATLENNGYGKGSFRHVITLSKNV